MTPLELLAKVIKGQVPEDIYQMDAFEFIEKFARRAQAIHASPPCQAYTSLISANIRQFDVTDGRIVLPIGLTSELVRRTSIESI